MTRYVKRREPSIEARQYTADTAQDVADWCGAQTITKMDGSLLAHTIASPGAVNAHAAIRNGDWVLYEKGRFRIMNPTVFAGLYEEA